MEEQFYEFLSDPNLLALIEHVKCSDDILDVIDLTENQHSNMLAWCFNPNEGHGQGDAVIRDFLEAAYYAHENPIWDNKKFFEIWTPGRIRTTSFGSAFLMREESVVQDDGRNGRLDLLLIDPRNKLIVCIENKAGARLGEEQLGRYKKAVKASYMTRPVFKDYEAAFIVLDRRLGSYGDEHLEKLGNEWALLDYAWLETSANRARLQVAKSNPRAQLLLSYCQKQTDWESESEKHISELAADIAIKHPEVVGLVREVRGIHATHWTPSMLNDAKGELLLFTALNEQVCDHLVRSQGIASLYSRFRKSNPHLSSEYIETGRTWLCATTADICAWMQTGEDQQWPLYINFYKEPDAGNTAEDRYTLRLVWYSLGFDDEKINADLLRAHFQTRFSALRKHVGSGRRRIVIDRNLNSDAVLKKAVSLLNEISDLAKSFAHGK